MHLLSTHGLAAGEAVRTSPWPLSYLIVGGRPRLLLRLLGEKFPNHKKDYDLQRLCSQNVLII